MRGDGGPPDRPAACDASAWTRLRQVVDPAGPGVAAVLRGEGGIGKSTVLNAVVEMATGGGVQVWSEAGLPLQQAVPFALVADLFRLHRAADPRRAAVWRLLVGDDAELGGPDDPYGKAMAVTEGLADVVVHESEDMPTLLVVDDLHWADGPPLLVLDRLLRRASQLGLRVVAATRPTDRSEVRAVIERAAEVGVGAVELAPLGEEDAVAVVGRLLDGRPGPHLTALAGGAAGNPLYLTELARAAAATGELRRDGRVIDLPDPAVPSSFRMTVLARLATLPEGTIRVLQVASIMGGGLDLAMLAALVDADPLAVLTHLRAAVVAHLVTGRAYASNLASSGPSTMQVTTESAVPGVDDPDLRWRYLTVRAGASNPVVLPATVSDGNHVTWEGVVTAPPSDHPLRLVVEELERHHTTSAASPRGLADGTRVVFTDTIELTPA